MSPNTFPLVRDSWRQAFGANPLAAVLFYQNLFAADPAFKLAWIGDTHERGNKFIRMMHRVLALLDKPQLLLRLVRRLAALHQMLGVFPHRIDTAGAAFFRTLDMCLGAVFTAEVRRAWLDLIAWVTQVLPPRGVPVPNGF